jgi:hypothetical protein
MNHGGLRLDAVAEVGGVAASSPVARKRYTAYLPLVSSPVARKDPDAGPVVRVRIGARQHLHSPTRSVQSAVEVVG